MKNKGIVAAILIGIGLWAWSKSRAEAKIKEFTQAKTDQQVQEALSAGATPLIDISGKAVGWIGEVGGQPVPIIPWGATPEQEAAAIAAFNATLITVSPAVQVTPGPEVRRDFLFYAYQPNDARQVEFRAKFPEVWYVGLVRKNVITGEEAALVAGVWRDTSTGQPVADQYTDPSNYVPTYL